MADSRAYHPRSELWFRHDEVSQDVTDPKEPQDHSWLEELGVLALASITLLPLPPDDEMPTAAFQETPIICVADENHAQFKAQLPQWAGEGVTIRAARARDPLEMANALVARLEEQLQDGPASELLKNLRDALQELGGEALERAERKENEWTYAEERDRVTALLGSFLERVRQDGSRASLDEETLIDEVSKLHSYLNGSSHIYIVRR